MMSVTMTIIDTFIFVLGVAWVHLTRTPSGAQVGVVVGTIGPALTIGLLAHGVP